MSQDIGTGRTRSRGFGLYLFVGEAPRERVGASMAAGEANDQVTGTWDGRPDVLLGTGCGPRPPQRAPMDSPRPGAALGPAVHSADTGHAADRDEDDSTSIDPECCARSSSAAARRKRCCFRSPSGTPPVCPCRVAGAPPRWWLRCPGRSCRRVTRPPPGRRWRSRG